MEEPTQMQTPENEMSQPVENVEQAMQQTESAQQPAAEPALNEATAEPKEAAEQNAAEIVPDVHQEPEMTADAEATASANEIAEQSAEPAEAQAEQENTEEPVAGQDESQEPQPEEPAATQETAETDESAEEEMTIDFASMGREELVELFQMLLDKGIQVARRHATEIKTRFFELTREIEKKNYEAFIAEGGNKDDFQPIEDKVTEQFRQIQEAYRVRRHQFLEQVEEQKKKNLEAKQQILEELRQLIDSDEETLKQTYDRFNAIQERWKTIGEVSREHLNDLWQNYHFLVEKFFNKINITKELRMLDLKHNLEQKIQLCEKAEELIVEENVAKAFKGLNQLRERWREIGPVPQEQNAEIWQRFCNAANQVDERRKEYYEQRKSEMEKNLLAKQALVDKVKELVSAAPKNVQQWNSLSSEIDEMLKLWKSIGPAEREANEEVWKQFKGVIDQFYAEKKAYFNEMRDEHTENYNRKIDLCLKAEAIAKRDDWKRATDEMLQLQAEWKSIGPVARKHSEKIWQRFRGACDEFFARKGEYYKNLRSSESDNLEKKEELLKQLKDYQFGDDKDENLNVIKDFQRRWIEIGHVPLADKDRLQQEFRNTINAHFERLKISAREAAENEYREHVQSNGGDRRFMSSEKQQLLEKIEKLRSSISLWENNLGFLANSRSADLLKQEFEKKMQSTRQQIALLEAKLKILAQNENKSENTEA